MRFDWIFYVNHYKDLLEAGIDTEDKAREHWKIFGQSEGRLCNPDQLPFNWHYYLALNEDLQNRGIDTKETAEEHWILYGRREGRICRPDCKILCILAVHLDSYLKVDTLINNIPYLNEISAKVVVVASDIPHLEYRSAELHDILETVEYHTIVNDPIRVCYDKYQYYLENNDYSQYDRVILTNDSYYIYRSLSSFRRYCLLDKDCISFSASNERSYHLTDYLRCYSRDGLRIILNYYRSKLVSNVNEAIQIFEIESVKLFNSFVVYRHAIPGYTQNIMFDTDKLSWAVLNQGLEVIKLKVLKRVVYTEFPIDFDPDIYIYLNQDLRHMTTIESIQHFREFGMSEGRPYKSDKMKLFPKLVKLFELTQFVVPKSLLGEPIEKSEPIQIKTAAMKRSNIMLDISGDRGQGQDQAKEFDVFGALTSDLMTMV